jgi:hypothetical protein
VRVRASTRSRVSSNRSTWASEWLADKVIRRRAVPSGTVGGRMAGTRTPASNSAAAVSLASREDPRINGWMGVGLAGTGRPSWAKPRCRRLISARRCSLRQPSLRAMSSDTRVAAASAAGHGRGVDVGSRELHQALDQCGAAGDEGASGPEGLAQCPHQYRYLVGGKAEMLATPAPLIAEHAKSVGVVDHQPGSPPPRGIGKGGQGGKITVHGEHPVCDDDTGLSRRRYGKQGGDMLRIRVPIATHTAARQAARIDQRGMIQAVFQHRVTPSRERLQNTEIGHVSGGEQQRPRAAGEARQVFLQFGVDPGVAVDQVRRPGAESVPLQRGTGGVGDPWIRC